MTQQVAGIVACMAMVTYGWAALWLANYPMPWSAPWHIAALSRWSAAGNAAIRVAVLALPVVALILPYTPGPKAPETVIPKPAVVPFHPGSLVLTWMLPLIGLAAFAGLTYLVARLVRHLPRQQRKSADEEGRSDSATFRELADQALTELLTETDPRRAILACYALMERRLASSGLPRMPEETALEYARRLLAGAGAPHAPLRYLTGLFHLAGFSGQAINESMRQTAISSLKAIAEAAQ